MALVGMRVWLAPLLLSSMLACTEPGGSDESEDETGPGETDAGEPEPGQVCDPASIDPCGPDLTCCSDDPAALDLAMLDQFVTPEYQGGSGQGVPIFSGGNNLLSSWGTCVDTDPPAPGTLDDLGVQGCPIPCNPTWPDDVVGLVCGASTQCCQTRPIEFIDCVLDSTLGEDGCWRPVTGTDIIGLGGIDATQWRDSDHATEQDPSGNNCFAFVMGISPDVLADYDVTDDDVLRACFRRLGVADQRGYCTALGTSCAVDPAALDACQLRNDEELRTDCAELLP